jgi:hypothetical protein
MSTTASPACLSFDVASRTDYDGYRTTVTFVNVGRSRGRRAVGVEGHPGGRIDDGARGPLVSIVRESSFRQSGGNGSTSA